MNWNKASYSEWKKNADRQVPIHISSLRNEDDHEVVLRVGISRRAVIRVGREHFEEGLAGDGACYQIGPSRLAELLND